MALTEADKQARNAEFDRMIAEIGLDAIIQPLVESAKASYRAGSRPYAAERLTRTQIKSFRRLQKQFRRPVDIENIFERYMELHPGLSVELQLDAGHVSFGAVHTIICVQLDENPTGPDDAGMR